MMAKTKTQRYTGIVYSTDSAFEYEEEENHAEAETLPPAKQRLTVLLDKKSRKGKMVTLITGFVGTGGDLESLGKQLKQQCAVGGSVKDGEIIIQGDFRKRIADILQTKGYNVKLLG